MEAIVQDPSQELDPEELGLIDEEPADEDAAEEEANEEIGEDAMSLRAEVMREALHCANTPPAPHHPYPHLREISTLASWTVSSHKPGCGILSLRSPSPSRFWQSDGPQPHVLSVHFFKRVAIAHLRLYLDHELDESYTPTRLQVWAGTGHHDLVVVQEMGLERPKGWLDVDLSGAGGRSEFEEGELEWLDEVEETPGTETHGEGDERVLAARRDARIRTAGRGATLRCFLVQVRILENHQNGKDTHLRGLQLFAKDEEALRVGVGRGVRRATLRAGPGVALPAAGVGRGGLQENWSVEDEEGNPEERMLAEAVGRAEASMADLDIEKTVAGLREAEWMREPEWR